MGSPGPAFHKWAEVPAAAGFLDGAGVGRDHEPRGWHAWRWGRPRRSRGGCSRRPEFLGLEASRAETVSGGPADDDHGPPGQGTPRGGPSRVVSTIQATRSKRGPPTAVAVVAVGGDPQRIGSTRPAAGRPSCGGPTVFDRRSRPSGPLGRAAQIGRARSGRETATRSESLRQRPGDRRRRPRPASPGRRDPQAPESGTTDRGAAARKDPQVAPPDNGPWTGYLRGCQCCHSYSRRADRSRYRQPARCRRLHQGDKTRDETRAQMRRLGKSTRWSPRALAGFADPRGRPPGNAMARLDRWCCEAEPPMNERARGRHGSGWRHRRAALNSPEDAADGNQSGRGFRSSGHATAPGGPRHRTPGVKAPGL